MLLSPLLVLVGMPVRLDGSPIIFAQVRMGRRGREFKMFKFCSMRLDSEKHLAELLAANKHTEGVTFKIKDDPRVTWIGQKPRPWRHPRQRLFHSLSLLLWEPEGTDDPPLQKRVQMELNSRGSSLGEWVAAYRALWHRAR